MANVITLNIDSSPSWDLAVPSSAGILQQTSGTIAELPAIASGFAVADASTSQGVPSIALANFREGSSQKRPDNAGPNLEDPDTEKAMLPLDVSKLKEWLNTYTPEKIDSPHLSTGMPDRQGWTYITDFTLHPATIDVIKQKELPLNYYLHGRIRHDGKLELAFFTEKYYNRPSEVSIDLANITLTGGGTLTLVQTLQYTCGNQTLNPLRIAGKEEAEKYLLSGGKLIKSRCPIFLGTLMHSGKAIFEIKYEGDEIEYEWPVVTFLGHMWSYWGVIADNVLYIVGLPVYNGDETGHVHAYWASSSAHVAGYYRNYYPADIPPTMPCDFPYTWGLGLYEDDETGELMDHFITIEEAFRKADSEPPASTQAVRDAYEKACNTQPYMYNGGSVANHSMAIMAAELFKDNSDETTAASTQYELSTVTNTGLSTKDYLSEGINMTGFLVGAEGGVYYTPTGSTPVQCIDGYNNPYGDNPSEYQDYGWITGVRYNDAGLKTDSSEPETNRLDLTNNVTTGFISIPAIFPWESGVLGVYNYKPDASDAPNGWIVHAFNVLQRGNTYTIWTSSWDGALKILSDTPEEPYICGPITLPAGHL